MENKYYIVVSFYDPLEDKTFNSQNYEFKYKEEAIEGYAMINKMTREPSFKRDFDGLTFKQTLYERDPSGCPSEIISHEELVENEEESNGRFC